VCAHQGRRQTTRTEAHHEPPLSHQGTDEDTCPLCDEHHDERHDVIGSAEFWEWYGLDWRAVIEQARARRSFVIRDSFEALPF
jgi:hypothetical protein